MYVPICLNIENIENAASEFGVNKYILAAIIYTEQRLNGNWMDDIADLPLGAVLDMSIGVSQVRVSTAKLLEDAGYISATQAVYVNGTEYFSREEHIALKLSDSKTNIRYAAAYLKYFQDRWEYVYPNIDGDTAVLGTLYNQGEINPPHSNPQPRPFGKSARGYYYRVYRLMN